MRVIICGAGQVGYNIAATLVREGNDVTIIDEDQALIAEINDELDALGIIGHAASPDILKQANASSADMILAVTSSDEVNMVACQIGHSLFNIPRKIARIRRQSYLQPEWANLFSRDQLPIDVIISPEQLVAQHVYQRLRVPGTSYVTELAKGVGCLIGVVCKEDCPVLYTPISQFGDLFPDLSFNVIGVLRDNQMELPTQTTQLEPGDQCFMVVVKDHLSRVLSSFGQAATEARTIVVAGGGLVGYGLVKRLIEKDPSLRIKIIEQNQERAYYLSEHLPNVIVLQGSALDRDILQDCAIENVETFVAVTNDDESNILSSILSKQYGCKRAVTLVNNNVYTALVGSLNIDTIVSPGVSVVADIMKHVRRGRVKDLHRVHDGSLEVLEIEVSETSAIVRKPVSELDMPSGISIIAVVEEDGLTFVDETYTIRPYDHLIVANLNERTETIENLFSAKVDIF